MNSYRTLPDPDECEEKAEAIIKQDFQYDNSMFRKLETRLTFIVLFSYQANFCLPYFTVI